MGSQLFIQVRSFHVECFKEGSCMSSKDIVHSCGTDQGNPKTKVKMLPCLCVSVNKLH